MPVEANRKVRRQHWKARKGTMLVSSYALAFVATAVA